MGKVNKPSRLFVSIVEAFFRQPETVDYPFGELHLPDAFRGAIDINPDQCSGCGLCVRNCPTAALRLEKSSRENFILFHSPARCAYCGECEAACRNGAIHHKNQLVSATFEPKKETVLVDKSEEGKSESRKLP